MKPRYSSHRAIVDNKCNVTSSCSAVNITSHQDSRAAKNHSVQSSRPAIEQGGTARRKKYIDRPTWDGQEAEEVRSSQPTLDFQGRGVFSTATKSSSAIKITFHPPPSYSHEGRRRYHSKRKLFDARKRVELPSKAHMPGNGPSHVHWENDAKSARVDNDSTELREEPSNAQCSAENDGERSEVDLPHYCPSHSKTTQTNPPDTLEQDTNVPSDEEAGLANSSSSPPVGYLPDGRLCIFSQSEMHINSIHPTDELSPNNKVPHSDSYPRYSSRNLSSTYGTVHERNRNTWRVPAAKPVQPAIPPAVHCQGDSNDIHPQTTLRSTAKRVYGGDEKSSPSFQAPLSGCRHSKRTNAYDYSQPPSIHMGSNNMGFNMMELSSPKSVLDILNDPVLQLVSKGETPSTARIVREDQAPSAGRNDGEFAKINEISLFAGKNVGGGEFYDGGSSFDLIEEACPEEWRCDDGGSSRPVQNDTYVDPASLAYESLADIAPTGSLSTSEVQQPQQGALITPPPPTGMALPANANEGSLLMKHKSITWWDDGNNNFNSAATCSLEDDVAAADFRQHHHHHHRRNLHQGRLILDDEESVLEKILSIVQLSCQKIAGRDETTPID